MDFNGLPRQHRANMMGEQCPTLLSSNSRPPSGLPFTQQVTAYTYLIVNLIAWGRILWLAAQTLRANGIPCGFMGADQAALKRLGKTF